MLLACASQAGSGRLLLGHFRSNDAVPHTGMHRLASNPGCLWRSCQQCAPHVTPYYSTGPRLRRCHKGYHCHDCHCCTSMTVPIKVNELAHHRANVCAAVGTTQSHNGKVVSGLFAHEFICHMLAHLASPCHYGWWPLLAAKCRTKRLFRNNSPTWSFACRQADEARSWFYINCRLVCFDFSLVAARILRIFASWMLVHDVILM